jgi:hypothetical protein
MRKYQKHLVHSCVSLQTRRLHTKLSYSENSVLPVHEKSVFNTTAPPSNHTLDEGRAAQTFPHIQINN